MMCLSSQTSLQCNQQSGLSHASWCTPDAKVSVTNPLGYPDVSTWAPSRCIVAKCVSLQLLVIVCKNLHEITSSTQVPQLMQSLQTPYSDSPLSPDYCVLQ